MGRRGGGAWGLSEPGEVPVGAYQRRIGFAPVGEVALGRRRPVDGGVVDPAWGG